MDEPLHIETGDVFFVVDKSPMLIASDLTTEPKDAKAVFATARDGFATLGDGKDFMFLGGHVSLDPDRGYLLLDVLPPLIHVRASSPESDVLQQLLTQLVGEARADRAGARLASTMLTQLVFLQAIRAHIAVSGPLSAGWLRALGDDRLAPALRLMHGDPGRSWQLGELAKAVCMSRTTFALRFKTVTGVAPLTYLLNWRMSLAQHALRERNISVFDLALSLGYTSESAFSNAFKRVVGMAPKRYQSAYDAAGRVAALE
jgi:AraC-like DNA-binding protein